MKDEIVGNVALWGVRVCVEKHLNKQSFLELDGWGEGGSIWRGLGKAWITQ